MARTRPIQPAAVIVTCLPLVGGAAVGSLLTIIFGAIVYTLVRTR